MIGKYAAYRGEDLRELVAVRTGAVRGVVDSGGLGACNLGSGAWGRGCLGQY